MSSRCPVGEAVDSLDEPDRSEVQAILDNHVDSIVISKWFTDIRKFKGCSTVAVNKHRKRECDCEDDE